ncbi:MAG: hypothetical protein ACXWPV_05270 [Candidatus Limnocylindrales bacterium]
MTEPLTFCERCGTHRDLLGPGNDDVFRRCPTCALNVCPNCWNQLASACLADAPFELGTAGPRSKKGKSGAALVAGKGAAARPRMKRDDPDADAAFAPAPGGSLSAAPATAAAAAGMLGIRALHAPRFVVGRPRLDLRFPRPRLALRGIAAVAVVLLALVASWQLIAFTSHPAAPTGDGSRGGVAAGAAGTPSPASGTNGPTSIQSAAPGDATPRGAGGGAPRGKPGGGSSTPAPGSTPRPTPDHGATPTPMPQPTEVISPNPTDPPTPEPTAPPTPEPTPEPTSLPTSPLTPSPPDPGPS